MIQAAPVLKITELNASYILPYQIRNYFIRCTMMYGDKDFVSFSTGVSVMLNSQGEERLRFIFHFKVGTSSKTNSN